MPPTPMPARWKDIFGVWSLVGIVLTFQAFAVVEMPPAGDEWWDAMGQILFMQLSRAWLWAGLTPLVWRLQRRIPARGKWIVPGVLAHAALCAALTLLVLWIRNATGMFLYVAPEWWLTAASFQQVIDSLSSRQLIDVALYGGILAAGGLLRMQAERRQIESQAGRLREQLAQQQLQGEILRAELVDAQMKALKERLHPHFLFNALNAVSGLVRRHDNERAVDAINRMSHLLRGLLGTEARKLIPLEQELDYCRIYLDIEKLRFDDKLRVEFAVDPLAHSARVPALLLQPLVENAIKHGISRRRTPGRVVLTARLGDSTLHLSIANDPAETLAGQPAPVGHGIGLSTLRSRLEKTYGHAASVEFTLAPPAMTEVRLALPLQTEASATASQHHLAK